MKSIFALLLVFVLFISGCAIPPPQQHRRQPAAPAPCTAAVHPITYNNLIAQVTINLTYTPKDLAGVQQTVPAIVINQLNADGRVDNNTFTLQNGQQMNFWYQFTVNNNNGQYTGSLRFGGWGQGFVHEFYTQYPYNDPEKLLEDLSDQSYAFIHGGWHDLRPSCPQN